MALGGCAAPQAVFLDDHFQKEPRFLMRNLTYYFGNVREPNLALAEARLQKLKINPGQRTQANE
jgi:hypothetical protein